MEDLTIFWVVVIIILKVLILICICYRICARCEKRRNSMVQSDQIQNQLGLLVQMPSGELVQVTNIPDANIQPPPYQPGQAGMMPYITPGRPVDQDTRVGISQKVGLMDQV